MSVAVGPRKTPTKETLPILKTIGKDNGKSRLF